MLAISGKTTLSLRYASLALLGFLLFSVTIASAAAPTGIGPDTGTVPSDYQFQLLGNSPVTYVKFGTNFYADQIDIAGDHVTFTNTALGSASNPSQEFEKSLSSKVIKATEGSQGRTE